MKSFHYFSALLFLASNAAWSGQVATRDEAIGLATNAIHKFHLTTLKDECGVIDVIEKPSYFDIVVRERHSKHCGGTAETGARLFSVRVRKQDGRLTSDVYDGTNYQPLDHKLDDAK
ncbi:MAG: hypothetical protein V4578_00005 [Pseudomonadota bacterium]